MLLNVGASYPVAAAATIGTAVVQIHDPHDVSGDAVDDAVVEALHAHARQITDHADRLQTILRAGWRLQRRGAVYASRDAHADELADLVKVIAGPGIPVEWCVPDGDEHLLAVGGLLSGHDAPPGTFPGAPLPALVENALTGAQHVVADADALASTVHDELLAAAAWWRDRPQDLSDHDGHELIDALEQLAATVTTDAIPSLISEHASPSRIFSDAPHTRIAVHPVSAIRFTGLMQARRQYGSLTLPPSEGLAGTLLDEGQRLADTL